MVAVLTVWESDYGVASVDINSLILITYAKFARIQCTINYGRNPLFYNMPRLYIEEDTGNREIIGFDDIWTYFRKKVFDIDHFVSQEQKSDDLAYFTYMKKSLLPGIYLELWTDQQNYLEFTRKWYRNALYFPISWWYPYQCRKTINDLVKISTPNEDIERYSYILIFEAKKCIDDLSTKLGTKNYFFGPDPSSLDAAVYGYLAPLLNVPVPVSQLQMYLKDQDNLVKFVKRISNSFFPQQKLEYKYVNKYKREDDTQDFQTPPRTIALAAFCAATAMITYGLINGIIRLPFR